MNWRARTLIRSTQARGQQSPEQASGSERLVPVGVRAAAAWSWRVLLIAAAATLVGYVLVSLSVVVIPALIAILLTALTIPVVNGLARIGVPRLLASAIGLIGLLVVVGGLLTLVGQQIASGFADLADQVLQGIDQIRVWLIDGPLHLTESQINDFMEQLIEQGQNFLETGGSQITAGVIGVASTVSSLVAGLFLALFAALFFLYEGDRIWSWCVRLLPKEAHERVDGAGRRGWLTLTSFVRATVLVALVDALGIGLVALILDVPFWFPIAVLVFLLAFVPIIGALVSGIVAILVALVAHGPWVALAMTIGVLVVQQAESHILQPILMGRMVRLHPLAVILAVGAGVYLAGIAGAFFAVPVVAVLNSSITYLVRRSRGEEPSEETESPPEKPPRWSLRRFREPAQPSGASE